MFEEENTTRTATSATRHSGEGLGASSSGVTSPPQVMSPSVEQNQSQETTSVNQQPPGDASLRPKKREEDLRPKSEQSQAEVKEEQENLRSRWYQKREKYTELRHHGPQNRHHDAQNHQEGPQTRMHASSIKQFGLSKIEVLLRAKIRRHISNPEQRLVERQPS